MRPPVIETPPGATELVGMRNYRSRVFDLGNGKHRSVSSRTPFHYKNTAGEWLEVDTQWEMDGTDIVLNKALYRARISTSKVGLRYSSRRGGEVQLHIKSLGASAATRPTPEIDGDKVWFREVAPNVDIYFEARPGGVEAFKVIKAPTGAHRHRWEIRDGKSKNIRMGRRRRGKDNRKRRIQITREERTRDPNVNPGFDTFEMVEEFTGKVIERDSQTRVPTLKDDPEYPIVIDYDVEETVVAENDDCWQIYGSAGVYLAWYHNRMGDRAGINDGHASGLRFQSVAIPSGATIDQAFLQLDVDTASGGGVDLEINADADADAAEWATSSPNRPGDVTPSTNSPVAWTPGTSSTTETSDDIKTIVQDIIDLGGWATGQDMRFALMTAGTSTAYEAFRIEDYPDAPDTKLLVDWTAGGGGGLEIPIVMHHRKMMGVG